MSTKKFFYFSIFIILILSCAFPFAMASEFDYVYLGGTPVGIVMDSPGLSICGKCEVITQNGATIPSLGVEIMPGDYLVSINEVPVDSLSDIERVLGNVKEGEEITLGIKRDNKNINYKLTPSLETLSKKLKLGLIIQDDLNGIGTLTYCTKDGKFGALGHSIASGSDKTQFGKLYECKIIGVKRPRVGEAGELQGFFDKNSISNAKIDENNDFGIFGKGDFSSLNLTKIKVGGKNTVKEGKAYIYTCVDGVIPAKYEIEIVKAYKQNAPTTKSMVIKVTDRRLVDKTGGILQGMSGSPIVQNDKLVGAVTHVFTSDATKGYGVYIDWML